MSEYQLFEEKYIRVNGIRIRYFDEGKGKTLVLLHGLGGSATNWFKNIKELSQNHRVIVPDLPSFGKSEIPAVDPDDVNYDFFAHFLKEFLKLLGIKKASIIGNSMGGGISVNFALKFPKNTEKLIIACGTGLGKEIGLLFFRKHPIVSRIFFYALSKEFVLRSLLRLVVYDPKTLDEINIRGYADWLKKPEIRKKIRIIAQRALGTEGQEWLFLDNLEKISVPTLIIWGNNDQILPSKHGMKAHELIKNSKLVIFDKCGHVPQIEKPKEFNRVLVEFLDKK